MESKLVGKELGSQIRFEEMMLKESVRKGLKKNGFIFATAIQAAAITKAQSGLDLIVQSAFGTGKTLIFCTLILESYECDVSAPQSLILAPTFELVAQIEQVLNKLGCFCEGFRAVSFVGGSCISDDRLRIRQATAIIATPSRLLFLIKHNVLNISQIKLFVIDEADYIYSTGYGREFLLLQKSMPKEWQTIACSTIFPDDLRTKLVNIMHNPQLVSEKKGTSSLVAIKQFFYDFSFPQRPNVFDKLDALCHIFGRIPFKQCMLFASSQTSAELIYKNFNKRLGNTLTCMLMTSKKNRETRLGRFTKFRDCGAKIVITTDFMALGVDSMNVNLVINLELPGDVTTYLQRVGRAGRYGSQGIAISLLRGGGDKITITRFMSEVGNGMTVFKFPQKEAEENLDFWDFQNFETGGKKYALQTNGNKDPFQTGEKMNLPLQRGGNKFDDKYEKINTIPDSKTSNVLKSIKDFLNKFYYIDENPSNSGSNIESLPEEQRIPSPVHNDPIDDIPDVLPSLNTQHPQQKSNLSINKCLQIETMPPQPTYNATTASSQPEIDANADLNGGSDLGGNSSAIALFKHASSQTECCGGESYNVNLYECGFSAECSADTHVAAHKKWFDMYRMQVNFIQGYEALKGQANKTFDEE